MKPLPLLLLVVALGVSGLRAAPEYPKQGPDIYDPRADGARLVAAAIKEARATDRHVLIDFGANWCIWCRRLHKIMADNADLRRAIAKDYVLVLVDVNRKIKADRNAEVVARYHNPMGDGRGIPVLVVLDGQGQLLTTQETGALEDGQSGHDPAKILAFLARWAPKS